MGGNQVKGNRRLGGWWIGFFEFLENPYIRFGLAPLLLLGIPSFFFLYYTEDIGKELVEAIDPAGDLEAFLNEKRLWVFAISVALIYLYNALPNFASYCKSTISSLTVPLLLTLKECMENIVVYKATRFGSQLEECQAKSLSNEQIFDTITQPKQQILMITHAIYEFLNGIVDDIDFKVRIVEIKDNVPVSWFSSAPEHRPPHTDISVLQQQESGISACLKSKSIEVIDDIEKEAKKSHGRRYVMGHMNKKHEIGSLLCYPIHHAQTDSYPYVITISADKQYFREKEEELYRWILDQFALRIRLEHSLLLMKED